MKKKSKAQLKSLGTILIGATSLFAAVNSIAAAPVVAHVVHPAVEVKSQGGLMVKDHGMHQGWFKIGGRVHIDNTVFPTQGKFRNDASGKNTVPAGAKLRRARLSFTGGQGPHWSYNFTVNYGSNNSFNIYNAYANYSGLYNNTNVALGQLSPPFGLENFSSSNDTLFLEGASATNAFSPDNGVGIYVDTVVNDQLLAQVQVYQPDINESAKPDSATLNPGKSERWAATGRLVFSPMHTDELTYHVGVSGTHQMFLIDQQGVAGGLTQSFYTSTQPFGNRSSSLSNLIGLGMGGTSNAALRVKYAQTGVVELAALMGPASVQAEYYMAKLKTASNGEVKPNGGYVQAGYVLTGESRSYDVGSGTVGRPKPMSEKGAVELGARYDFINLNKNGMTGGKQHNVTVGVNWWANNNVRISTNYVGARIRPATMTATQQSAKKSINALAMRVDAHF